MTICVFVLSEAKMMMATQSHPIRRASRVAHSNFGPRVSTSTVEYKMAVIMLFWSLLLMLLD